MVVVTRRTRQREQNENNINIKDNQNKTNFFSLPLEIRNMIYDLVIQPTHCKDVPTLFHNSGWPSLRCSHQFQTAPATATPNKPSTPASRTVPKNDDPAARILRPYEGCTSLLQTCRQIYAETSPIVRGLPKIVFFPDLPRRQWFYSAPACLEDEGHGCVREPRTLITPAVLTYYRNLHVQVELKGGQRWGYKDLDLTKTLARLAEMLQSIDTSQLRMVKVYLSAWLSDEQPADTLMQACAGLVQLQPSCIDVSIVHTLENPQWKPSSWAYANRHVQFTRVPKTFQEWFVNARREFCGRGLDVV